MFKFKNIFLVSVIQVLFGCAILPAGKNYRDVALEEFPKTTQAIQTASQISQNIVPAPYAQILNVMESLSLLGLGFFALNKHRRISRIESVLNGNIDQPKIPPPSKSLPE